HAGKAFCGVFCSGFAGEFRPLRPFAERARAPSGWSGVAVYSNQTARRLSFLDPVLQCGKAIDLCIEPAIAVGETRDHVEAQKRFQALLAERFDLPLVVVDGIVRSDEVVRSSMSHDDLTALRAKLLQADIGDVHD